MTENATETKAPALRPEERARVRIDAQLADAGWHVCDRDHFTSARNAVALTEGLLNGNLEADYLLFLDGKIVGILEAKRPDIDLEQAAGEQAVNYTYEIPSEYPVWNPNRLLVFLANGERTLLRERFFEDDGSPRDRFLPLAKMLTPKECADALGVASYWAGLPELTAYEIGKLRNCQVEAITHLESSFRRGADKALLVLATGAGKTYTACMAAYRLLSYTPAKRILFLVDRNNLGEQAINEFSTFRLTKDGSPFTDVFITERIKGNQANPKASLTVSTIQRLYATLTGTAAKSDAEEDEECGVMSAEGGVQCGMMSAEGGVEGGVSEAEINSAINSALRTPNSALKLPRDYFDAIIIDECHRSIYGRWRAVLDYFDTARFIGLTATPSAETLEFFDKNLAVNYTFEKSITDGINVDYQVYRIKTRSSSEGVDVAQGEPVDVITRRTGERKATAAKEDVHYDPSALDRAVVQPDQIRQVLEAYKKAVYTEMFVDDLARTPDFASLPKTLVFAKSEDHARRIVEIAREVFDGQSPDFVQTITYSAGDPQKLIREFRNSKTFRIAVTVTLVATGTDIRPLEVLLFMRDVNAYSLYVQMRGRGCRTVNPDQLRAVTPNANGKEQFFLVDAVGVTEHPMEGGEEGGGRREEGGVAPVISLPRLLEKLSYGIVSDEHLRLLASRLARLNARVTPAQALKFRTLAGFELRDKAAEIYEALDDPALPPFENAAQPNARRRALVSPLVDNLPARDYLLELNAGYVVIQKPGHDEVIYTGFSVTDARTVLDGFEAFLKANPTDNATLAAIGAGRDARFDYAALTSLRDDALRVSKDFSCPKVWSAYALLRPADVVKLATPAEREAVTNWLGLSRFGLGASTRLFSLLSSSRHFSAPRHFELWKGQKQHAPVTAGQNDVLKEILPLVLANGAMSRDDLIETGNAQLLAEGVKAFGSLPAFDAELESLSTFFMKAV